jgi:hypothetical protein
MFDTDVYTPLPHMRHCCTNVPAEQTSLARIHLWQASVPSCRRTSSSLITTKLAVRVSVYGCYGGDNLANFTQTMEQGEGSREFSAAGAKPKPEFSFTKAIHARLQTSMGEWE